jgi:ribosomal protein L12E/L44/L45/RPP1/RPP2
MNLNRLIREACVKCGSCFSAEEKKEEAKKKEESEEESDDDMGFGLFD